MRLHDQCAPRLTTRHDWGAVHPAIGRFTHRRCRTWRFGGSR